MPCDPHRTLACGFVYLDRPAVGAAATPRRQTVTFSKDALPRIEGAVAGHPPKSKIWISVPELAQCSTLPASQPLAARASHRSAHQPLDQASDRGSHITQRYSAPASPWRRPTSEVARQWAQKPKSARTTQTVAPDAGSHEETRQSSADPASQRHTDSSHRRRPTPRGKPRGVARRCAHTLNQPATTEPLA